MAANPTEVAFSFFSLPVDSTGQFTAALESVDGSVSQPFAGPLRWTSGVVQMAGYAGSASVLSGNLTLSNTMSQEIFAGSEAELLLTYAGPDITVDMPGYSLNQDLAVSLENSELSIGALNYSVDLTDGPLSGSAVPEPDSARLLLLSGVALCLFSLALKRFRDVPH